MSVRYQIHYITLHYILPKQIFFKTNACILRCPSNGQFATCNFLWYKTWGMHWRKTLTAHKQTEGGSYRIWTENKLSEKQNSCQRHRARIPTQRAGRSGSVQIFWTHTNHILDTRKDHTGADTFSHEKTEHAWQKQQRQFATKIKLKIIALTALLRTFGDLWQITTWVRFFLMRHSVYAKERGQWHGKV